MPGINHHQTRSTSFVGEVERNLRSRGIKIEVLRGDNIDNVYHSSPYYCYEISFKTPSGKYIITNFKRNPELDQNETTLNFTDNSGIRKELDLPNEMSSITGPLPSLSDFVIGVINANEKTITQSKIEKMKEALQGKGIEFEVNDAKVVYGKRITQIKFQNEAGETFKIRIPGQNGEVSVHQAQSYKGRSGPAIEGLESVSQVIEALNNRHIVPQQSQRESQRESQQESRRPSPFVRRHPLAAKFEIDGLQGKEFERESKA